MMGAFRVCAFPQRSHRPPGLLSTQNVVGVAEELKYYFYVTLINLNVTRHLRLVAALLDSAALE